MSNYVLLALFHVGVSNAHALNKSAGLLSFFVDVLVIHLVIALSSPIITHSTDFCFRCPTPAPAARIHYSLV